MLSSKYYSHLSWYIIRLLINPAAAFGVCHLWRWRTSAKSDFRVTRTEYPSPLESDLGEVYCNQLWDAADVGKNVPRVCFNHIGKLQTLGTHPREYWDCNVTNLFFTWTWHSTDQGVPVDPYLAVTSPDGDLNGDLVSECGDCWSFSVSGVETSWIVPESSSQLMNGCCSVEARMSCRRSLHRGCTFCWLIGDSSHATNDKLYCSSEKALLDPIVIFTVKQFLLTQLEALVIWWFGLQFDRVSKIDPNWVKIALPYLVLCLPLCSLDRLPVVRTWGTTFVHGLN